MNIPGTGDRLVTITIKADGEIKVEVMRIAGGLAGEGGVLYLASSETSDTLQGRTSHVLDTLKYFGVLDNVDLPEIPSRTHMRFVETDGEVLEFVVDRLQELQAFDQDKLRHWVTEEMGIETG